MIKDFNYYYKVHRNEQPPNENITITIIIKLIFLNYFRIINSIKLFTFMNFNLTRNLENV